MSAIAVQTVVAVFPNYWGKAATMAEAERQAKRAGYDPARLSKDRKGKLKAVYYLISAPEDQVTVGGDVDCRVQWPKDATVMRLESFW